VKVDSHEEKEAELNEFDSISSDPAGVEAVGP
jgi:hypothetical protein